MQADRAPFAIVDGEEFAGPQDLCLAHRNLKQKYAAIAEAAEDLRTRLAKADCVIERIADMYDDERAQFQQKQDAYDMADAARTYLHDRDAALSTVAPVREG